MRFEWNNDKEKINIDKHNEITFTEAFTADEVIRIFSARAATKEESKSYFKRVWYLYRRFT